MTPIDLTASYEAQFWQNHQVGLQNQSDKAQLVALPKSQNPLDAYVDTSPKTLGLFVLNYLKQTAASSKLSPQHILNLYANTRKICDSTKTPIDKSTKKSTQERIKRQISRIIHSHGFEILQDNENIDRLIPIKSMQVFVDAEYKKNKLITVNFGDEHVTVKLFSLKKSKVLYKLARTSLKEEYPHPIDLSEVEDRKSLKLYISHLELGVDWKSTIPSDQLIKLLHLCNRFQDSSTKNTYEQMIIKNFDYQMKPKQWNIWMQVAHDNNSHVIVHALQDRWIWGIVQSIIDTSFTFEGCKIPDSPLFKNFGGKIISELSFFGNRIRPDFFQLYHKFHDYLISTHVLPPKKPKTTGDSSLIDLLSDQYSRDEIAQQVIIYQAIVRLSSKIELLEFRNFENFSYIKEKTIPKLESLKILSISLSEKEACLVLEDDQFYKLLKACPNLEKCHFYMRWGIFPLGGSETIFSYNFKENNNKLFLSDNLKKSIKDHNKITVKMNLTRS